MVIVPTGPSRLVDEAREVPASHAYPDVPREDRAENRAPALTVGHRPGGASVARRGCLAFGVAAPLAAQRLAASSARPRDNFPASRVAHD